MELREADIRRLLLWWATQSESAEDLLAEDFVYTSHIERHGRGDFLLGIRAQAPARDVRLLAVLVSAAQAVAFFEAVDSTTNLRHRMAWLLDHDGEKVQKITAVYGMLSA